MSVWKQVKIGGGGYVTGIDKSTDETTIVCRNDTYGDHIWNPSTGAWVQLDTISSLPVSPVTLRQPEAWIGTVELRVAPSNPNRLYRMHSGDVYRSDNRGLNWTKLELNWGLISDDAGQNAARFMGQKMAVDPVNPDVVYVGTPSGGVYRSFNAGGTWAQISTGTIPACSTTFGGVFPGHPGICFDPTSGLTGGRTNKIYIPVWGVGVYRSTDAGASWAVMAGAPTLVRHAKVDQSGNYYVACNNPADADKRKLHKWNGSAWSDISPGDTTIESMLIDPANANRVIAVNGGGTLMLSTDGGTSFGSAITKTRVSPDMPWLAYTDEDYMALGDAIFVGNEIWLAHGIGVAKTSFSGNPSSVVWTYITKGIENLTVNDVVCPPNGKMFTASWDRAVHVITNPEVYPSFHYPDNKFRMAWNLDWASSDPRFLAFPSMWGSVLGGPNDSRFGWKSSDGGVTWSAFTTSPGIVANIPLRDADNWLKVGGSIACSTPNNIIIVPANNALPWYTKDGGTTWTEITIAGVTTTPGDQTGFSYAYYNNMKCAAADRVTANTFYLYNYLTGKVYRSTDSGDNWTPMNAIAISVNDIGAFGLIKSVPGFAGHLFMVGGPDGNTGDPNPGNKKMLRSTNGGATWAEIPGFTIREPHTVGFGKAAPGQSYPAIAFVGWLDGVYGVWLSTNNCVSWTSLGDFPLDLRAKFVSIDGHKETFGTWYGALAGTSFVYHSEESTPILRGGGWGNRKNIDIVWKMKAKNLRDKKTGRFKPDENIVISQPTRTL